MRHVRLDVSGMVAGVERRKRHSSMSHTTLQRCAQTLRKMAPHGGNSCAQKNNDPDDTGISGQISSTTSSFSSRR